MLRRLRVILQAGHSDAFPPYLSGGGGAPGEADWTTTCALALSSRLQAVGLDVVIVGAWLTYQNGQPVLSQAPDDATKDADLFLSLHYDAAIYGSDNTGCLAGRATLDPMGSESDRFLSLWCQTYPQQTGIPLRQERLNANLTDYYAFRDTSSRTPGVLLEHGVGQGDDHGTLFDRLDTVVAADCAVLLQFLGIGQPAPEPPPAQEGDEEAMLTPDEKDALDTLRALSWNKASIETAINRLGRASEVGRLLQQPRMTAATRKALGQEMQAWQG